MTAETQRSLPVIMLMGPPGSGKGTQAALLEREYGLSRIETGAFLHKLRTDPSPLGQRVKVLYDAGRLSPPPLVAELVIRECRRLLEFRKGVVLDGSPRTLFEAERLLAALIGELQARALVILLDVPQPETVSRVLRRWVCRNCRQVMAAGAQPEDGCPACGGQLERRPDDTAEVIESRWEEYLFRTHPVVEYFKRQGLVAPVDGHRSISDVWTAVQESVQRRLGLL